MAPAPALSTDLRITPPMDNDRRDSRLVPAPGLAGVAGAYNRDFHGRLRWALSQIQA